MPHAISNMWVLGFFVLLLNLPFGFFRAGVRKFTLPWFLAVHVPIPFVVGLRLLSGLRFRLVTFPVFIGAFFSGQFLGGWVRRWLKPKP